MIGTHSDLSTSEARAGIETDTVTTSTTVNLDLTSVGLEGLRRVLGGHTALNCKAALRDSLLSEAKLRQGCTRSNLNLSGDDVDTRDLLYQNVNSTIRSHSSQKAHQ